MITSKTNEGYGHREGNGADAARAGQPYTKRMANNSAC